MLDMMEANELIIHNDTSTAINDAIRGLLTAEAAAINTIVRDQYEH